MQPSSPALQVLYALALVPVGFLADKADRPRLLAGGLFLWSLLTMVASKAPRCCCLSPMHELSLAPPHHLSNLLQEGRQMSLRLSTSRPTGQSAGEQLWGAAGNACAVCGGAGDTEPHLLQPHTRALPQGPHDRHGCLQLRHLLWPRALLCRRHRGRAPRHGHRQRRHWRHHGVQNPLQTAQLLMFIEQRRFPVTIRLYF